jgi:group I intron endonuclease
MTIFNYFFILFAQVFSYFAKALSLGLRLTANMIDGLAFFFTIIIFFDLLYSDSIIIYSFIPIIIYSNAETDKSTILTSNKGKAAIYMWTHIESDKIYVGSATDLSKRLSLYFSKKHIGRFKKVYIYNALLLHGYAAFSLSILEYINISGLSKEEAQKLILEREQNYLNLIFSVNNPNTFNILQVAGSRLGSNHTTESRALMSIAKSGENHFMYGKTHSEETLKKMREAHKGKTLSAETKAKMSLAQRSIDRTGENSPMFGRTGESNPFYGRTHSAETRAKMSLAKNKKVFVYSFDSLSNKKHCINLLIIVQK